MKRLDSAIDEGLWVHRATIHSVELHKAVSFMEFPMFVNLIDFCKVVNSVHCLSWPFKCSLPIWYTTPKLVELTPLPHDNFESSIILNGPITDSFPVESGVRQSTYPFPYCHGLGKVQHKQKAALELNETFSQPWRTLTMLMTW